MTHNSLRLRLVAGGAVTIVIALAIAGVVLTLLFERHVERTVAADLEVYLNQLLAGIDINSDNRIIVTRPAADPRFAEPLSGLYWQISDGRDQLLRSRSLWDTALSLPAADASQTDVHSYEIAGPAGTRLLVAERRVTLTIEGKPVPIRIAVAENLARVSAARTAFANDLVLALGLSGSSLLWRPRFRSVSVCVRSMRCAEASPISARGGTNI